MLGSKVHGLKKVQVNYTVAYELRDELIRIADRRGCSVSHLIREMMNVYIPILNKEDDRSTKQRKNSGVFID